MDQLSRIATALDFFDSARGAADDAFAFCRAGARRGSLLAATGKGGGLSCP